MTEVWQVMRTYAPRSRRTPKRGTASWRRWRSTVNDDPRRERKVTVTVLAYPDMPDEEITGEVSDLLRDPRVAFTVERVEMCGTQRN